MVYDPTKPGPWGDPEPGHGDAFFVLAIILVAAAGALWGWLF